MSTASSPASSSADDYARLLLGGSFELRPAATDGDSDIGSDWAVSGLMPLCGSPDGPPLAGPGMLPTCARGALNALRTIARRDVLPGVDGATLLAERAAMLGLRRRGRISANGTCELIEAKDGWIACPSAERPRARGGS